MEIKYTLLTDGSSDRVLKYIIDWLLDNLYPKIVFSGSYGDIRGLPSKTDLGDIKARVAKAELYYPFDILFYHRDAESRSLDSIAIRKNEVMNQLSEKQKSKTICVVPVKMMETWLLINKEAIKKAAGNRNYRGEVELPSLNRLENETNPKDKLHKILRDASGRNQRALKKFDVSEAVQLVGDNISDFAPLRQLIAFQEFEKDVTTLLTPLINMRI
jgi:predicted secreted acid phosphatase